MKAGTDTDIGLDYTDDVESRYMESARKTIETPWPIITSLSKLFIFLTTLKISFKIIISLFPVSIA